MHGDLRTTSLEQLCRTLDARQATGELTIHGEGNQIRVWFRQGRVVRATASKHELRLGDRLVHGGLMTAADLAAGLQAQAGSGRHLGEVLVEEGLVNRHVVRAFMQEQVLDALFAAIRWTSGEYTFEDDEIPSPAVPTDLTVAQLLFALETRHRVWDEITRTIPNLDRVPEFVPGADPSEPTRDQGEAAVVAAIDGRRSVHEISEELGFGPYEVAAVVHGLTVLGQVRLQQTEVALADPASAAATAISEAAAFLRGDGPAPTPLHEVIDEPAPPAPHTPSAAPVDAPAEPEPFSLDTSDVTVETEVVDLAPLPDAPADIENKPSSLDFAASLADMMADLDVDGPRGGRRDEDEDATLAVIAPDPEAEAAVTIPTIVEDPAADLPLPAPPGAAVEAPAPAPVAEPAPAPPPAAAPAVDEEETTFLIMDEDLSQDQPANPPSLIPPMDSRPRSLDGEEEPEKDPEPWAFVIGGDDADEEPAPRRRRQPPSPITSKVTADPSTGTPLPTPSAAPEPDPTPAPAPEPQPAAEVEPDVPAAPKRPRQTGEMSDLLRELRQLSDE